VRPAAGGCPPALLACGNLLSYLIDIGEYNMGLVYEDITLKNAGDIINVQRGIIDEGQIRQVNVRALVDTGAGTMVINEDMRRELGLEIVGKRQAKLANEAAEMCRITEPVEIDWKGRSAVVRTMVLDSTKEVLLGAMPLEEMDVMVDPQNQRLVGIHGDEIILKIK